MPFGKVGGPSRVFAKHPQTGPPAPVLRPAADFTGTPLSGAAPLTVQFTYTGNAPGDTVFAWNFGDGSPAGSARNPSHAFATPGTYDVAVTATNSAGQSVRTRSGYVTAS